MTDSTPSSSSTGSDSSSGSWELHGAPHPKYYRVGGYHPTSINELINARYRTIQRLGHGFFSTVWLVYDYDYRNDMSTQGRLSPFKALKIQKSSRSCTEAAQDEIKIYQRLGTAKYVSMLLDHFNIKGKFGTHICLVFPLLGDNLDSVLKKQGKIPFPIVRNIVNQTLRGLVELQKKDIIHADLKTENILVTIPNKKIERIIRMYKVPPITSQPKLLDKSVYILTKSQKKRQKKMIKAKHNKNDKTVEEDDTYDWGELNRVCICDLGNACTYHNKYGTEVQTKHYQAPEVLLGNDYNQGIDIWSLGCIAYELITCELLFDCDSDSEIDYQENHLANIVETVGDLPQYMLTGGKYTKRYLTTDGSTEKPRFKHIKKLSHESIYQKLVYKDIDNAREISTYIAPLLTIDMNKRYELFYR